MMNRKRNKAITALRALVALPICLALLMLWAEKAEARMDYGQTTSLQAIQDPIYVVDGKVYASIDHIASDNILTIDVTADPEIVFMYGGTAGQDVVQIVLKEKIHPIEEDAHLLEETMEPSSPSVGQDQPLYILEGVEIDHTTANNIDPNDIKIVRVYKDDEATKRYGEKARNGVVEIYLKNSQQEITEQHPEPDMNEEYAVEFAPIQEPSPDTDELQGAVTSPLKSQEMISHKAFPVPAHETLTIAYNTHNLTGDVTIDLLDLQGKKVASQSGLPSGNSSTSFELGALPNGTYLYTVTVDNQTAATGKVVVNK